MQGIIYPDEPLPGWYLLHDDARLCGVPVFAAKSIRQVPYYIRQQARAYTRARREARRRICSDNKVWSVMNVEI